MSKNVIIYEGVETNEDLAEQLRHIASLIDGGATSGYYPGWEVVEEDNE